MWSIDGFSVSLTGGDAMDISHLLFADDSLVFFYADKSAMSPSIHFVMF